MSARALLAVPGALLLVGVVLDAARTTLSPGTGGGLITRATAQRLTDLGVRLQRSRPGPRRRLLLATGPLTLLATASTWVLLLWTGWTLVFCASEGAVRVSQTSAPADVLARVYFAGFTVSSLGVGDVVPGTGLWQVLTALASFVGLALITLSITYLLNVLSAATAHRRLAREIAGAGGTGAGIVLLHWDGTGLVSALTSWVQSTTGQLLQTTEQHLTYPVLHTFHAAEPASSAPRALAVLDDALVLLSTALAPPVRPPDAVLVPLRAALEHYGETVASTGRCEGIPAPPAPDRTALERAGVPLVDEDVWRAGQAQHLERRERLARLVQADAWDWPVG